MEAEVLKKEVKEEGWKEGRRKFTATGKLESKEGSNKLFPKEGWR